MILDVARPGGTWRIVEPETKLVVRGRLPGAFNYDRTAATFRDVIHTGFPALALVAPAMPASWMVNNRAPSPVLRRWLEMSDAWSTLIDALGEGPETWLSASEDVRAEVTDAVRELSTETHQSCAVSKVLALLCPDTVPLMDDAALWLLADLSTVPDTADRPSAEPDAFVPMIDAFCRAAVDHELALLELSRGYTHNHLSPSQVLDRLLWFDSWGAAIVRPKWTREETDSVITVRQSQPLSR